MTETGNGGGSRFEVRSHRSDSERGGGKNSKGFALRERGFTLLEVVFAGMILTVALLGLSGTMAQGHAVTSGVSDELTARRAIRSKMAEIRDAPFSTLMDQFHDKEFSVERLQERPRRCRVTVADGPSPGLFKITVTMRWTVSGKQRSLSQTYLLTKIRDGGVQQ